MTFSSPAMNPTLSLPVAAALAMAPISHGATPQVGTLPPIPDPIGFAGGFVGVYQNYLLAGGGANFPDGVMPWDGGKKVWHDRLFMLDLAHPENPWKLLGKLPERNGYGVSITSHQGIFIIGGSNETRHLTSVYQLTLDDHNLPQYTPLPPLPQPLALMCGALVGRTIHLCGGISTPDATSALNHHWTLDLDDPHRQWTKAEPLPAAGRILATAAAPNHSFIVAGGCMLSQGYDGKPVRTYLSDAWKFSNNKWTQLADLPYPVAAAATPAPLTENAFFIVSGDDGTQVGKAPTAHSGFRTEILRHDMITGKWSVAGHLTKPAPVTLPTAPWQKNTFLFNGEIKPGIRTPQVLVLKF